MQSLIRPWDEALHKTFEALLTEIRQDQSDQGSSLYPTLLQSLVQTFAVRPDSHRLQRSHAARLDPPAASLPLALETALL